MRTNGKFSFISASESFTIKEPASYLLKQETSSYFGTRNEDVGDYFEIHLLNGYFVFLTGYGFMSTDQNNAPRNWNVKCVSTKPQIILANVVNNDTLRARTIDKKAFECKNNLIKCTDIRFTSTGPCSSSSLYNLILAGVELFGYLKSAPNDLCMTKISHHFSVFFAFIQFLLISS